MDLAFDVTPELRRRAELGSTLRLGEEADERLGTSPATGTAWSGSGFPLLAWVRGQGWVRDDLVGNDQARDPWIDEASTTWAQAVVTDTTGDFALDDVPDRVRGDLGAPMSEWATRGFGPCNVGVYTQGAATLLAARERVGAERFDDAVRSSIATHAHRVVTPADVARSFADLPEVIDELTRAGALPPPG